MPLAAASEIAGAFVEKCVHEEFNVGDGGKITIELLPVSETMTCGTPPETTVVIACAKLIGNPEQVIGAGGSAVDKSGSLVTWTPPAPAV